MISLLFVCKGNICRSPALQGCMQHIVDKEDKSENYYIDSCGTSSAFCGHKVDSRTQAAALHQGIVLSHIAREFQLEDFLVFDYIFAATKQVQQLICSLSSVDDMQKKVYLATHFSSLYKDQDIIDPYHQPMKGFKEMMNIAIEATHAIFHYLENTHGTFNRHH